MTAAPNTAALQELLARVEAGDEVPPKLIINAFGVRRLPNGWDVIALIKWILLNGIEAMGAAKALHEAVLLGRSCGITFGGEYGATVTFPPTWDDLHLSVSNAYPARAWLIAILRALAAPVTPANEGGV